jgi:hypothetical protein
LVTTPYTDHSVNDNEWIRTFSVRVNDESLVWHRDYNNRTIEVLEGDGWEMQFEDELPFAIYQGRKIKVKAMEYHRLIKGTTDLVLRIKETD